MFWSWLKPKIWRLYAKISGKFVPDNAQTVPPIDFNHAKNQRDRHGPCLQNLGGCFVGFFLGGQNCNFGKVRGLKLQLSLHFNFLYFSYLSPKIPQENPDLWKRRSSIVFPLFLIHTNNGKWVPFYILNMINILK